MQSLILCSFTQRTLLAGHEQRTFLALTLFKSTMHKQIQHHEANCNELQQKVAALDDIATQLGSLATCTD